MQSLLIFAIKSYLDFDASLFPDTKGTGNP